MRVKLMADYDCWPLWTTDSKGATDNVDPARLPLSSRLVAELADWAERYNQILNRADPASSRFPSEADEIAFAADGILLARVLADELGRAWQVSFFDEHKDQMIEVS